MKSTIVILHGWGSKIKRWQKMKILLEAAGFEVFLPELPGFGQTKPPSRPWSVFDYGCWLQERIKERSFKNYFLAGHSFGGRVAIKIAKDNPENIKGLILIDSAGIKPKNSFKKIFCFFLAKIGKLLFLIPPFFIYRQIMKKILYKLIGEKDYYQAKGVMKKTLIRVVSEDLKKDLEKIKVPTLILWGERDKLTPLSDGKLMNSLIKNSSLKIFPNIGHGLPLKFPKKAAQEIIKFCQREK